MDDVQQEQVNVNKDGSFINEWANKFMDCRAKSALRDVGVPEEALDAAVELAKAEGSRASIILSNEVVEVTKAAKGVAKWGKNNPIKTILLVFLAIVGLK